jgi:hypothetical protein
MTTDIKRMKNIYGANAATFLLDSTLSPGSS